MAFTCVFSMLILLLLFVADYRFFLSYLPPFLFGVTPPPSLSLFRMLPTLRDFILIFLLSLSFTILSLMYILFFSSSLPFLLLFHFSFPLSSSCFLFTLYLFHLFRHFSVSNVLSFHVPLCHPSLALFLFFS